MKALQKNWLLPGRKYSFINKIQGAAFCFLYFTFNSNSQIVNYVQNGSFEKCLNCQTSAFTYFAEHWTTCDTNLYNYALLSDLPPSGQVPSNGNGWQWPKSGHNYIITTTYLPNNIGPIGYPSSNLKQTLQAGKTYCVKFYCSITNQSSYGMDAMGAYFGDDNLDTIKNYVKPLSYLTPQVQNPSGNVLTDTLNWILITGTLTATGNEKRIVLGSFKSEVTTNSQMINPANLPTIFTDILYDDVSCIDLDLPADAGPDTYTIPGDSVFIGRTPDVGINEACTWYKLPNLATPIATVAGLYVKPVITSTYVVRQEICGLIRWDSVVVFQSAVGIESQKGLSQNLKVYPVPALNELILQWDSEVLEKEFKQAEIINSLGQTIDTVDLIYNNRQVKISVGHLPGGVYLLRLRAVNVGGVTKRFVVER